MWNEARIINATANLLTVLAVLTLLGAALVWLVRLPAFDFKNRNRVSTRHFVSVCGARLDPQCDRRAVVRQFFTMNLGQARQTFETAAWVRQAQVRRVWPNMLRVTIEEQKPQGLWNENQLINTWGEVFTANRGALENEASLPQFQGPEGTGILMIQRYAELRQWFEQIGIQVRGLTLTNRYALQVTLSNGLTLELGRDPGAGRRTLKQACQVR